MSKGMSKILGLELENFMSIKEAKLVFDETNIINLKGYNDSGKSAITRALDVLMFCCLTLISELRKTLSLTESIISVLSCTSMMA